MWTPKRRPEAKHLESQSQHWFFRLNETPDLVDYGDARRWFRLALTFRLLAKDSNPVEHRDVGDPENPADRPDSMPSR